MYSLADLRAGQAIEMDGDPYLVLSAQFSRKSQGKPNCVTKIKNLKTGSIVQKTFIGNERIPPADVGYRHVQLLYGGAQGGTCMDLKTYDQFDIEKNIVGDAFQYFTDGMELDLLFYEEKPIGVKLPVTVDLKVVETTPGIRGNTAQGGTKPARLQSGITIQVPLFVNEEDTVRVNTERGEYVERV